MLFQDERETLRAAVERQLAARFDLVAIDVDDVVSARIAARLLHPSRPACARPPGFDDVARAGWPGAVIAHVVMACAQGPCSLAIGLSLPTGGGSPLRADVAEPASLTGWLEAAKRLVPTEPGEGYGIGRGYGCICSELVQVVIGSVGGPWAAAPSYEPDASAQRLLDACHDASPDRYHDAVYELLVEVGRDGHVARCEALPDFEQRDAECFCAGVRGARFRRGEAGRRLLFDVTDFGVGAPDERVSASLSVPDDDDDDGWELYQLLQSTRAEACYVQAGLTEATAVHVSVTIAGSGHVSEVSAAHPNPVLRRCVTELVGGHAFSCRAVDAPVRISALVAFAREDDEADEGDED